MKVVDQPYQIVTKQKNELALIIELSVEGEEWLSFVHYKINLKTIS